MAMEKFRKAAVLVFCALISILLASCTSERGVTEPSDNDTYISNDYAEEADEYDNEEAAVQIVFTGEPVRREDLYWPEGRDRDWEEDIRHFAAMALRHHPLLIGYDELRLDARRIEGRASENYSEFAYNVLLKRTAAKNGILTDDLAAITERLREIILEKTNALIIDIPNLSDYEVVFSLSEIAAILGDGHTRIAFAFEDSAVFPVSIIALDGRAYLTGVPKEFENALYSELLSINNIPIDEVIEGLARIIPHENEYNLRQMYIPRALTEKELLIFINVVSDSGVAEFTVRDISGEIFDITLQGMNREVIDAMEFVYHFHDTLMHARPGELFWHEYFPDDNIMYVRIWRFFREPADNAAIAALRAELRDWPENEDIEKFIIDLRHNIGGFTTWPFGEDFLFLADRVNSLYVIIDGISYSQSVIVASNLKYHMDNLTIIGEPAGQPENFLSGDQRAFLPNSRLGFQVSNAMSVQSNTADTALRPDIFIPLTIDDVINQRDPVLEYILAGQVD